MMTALQTLNSNNVIEHFERILQNPFNSLRELANQNEGVFSGQQLPAGARLRKAENGWLLEVDLPGVTREEISLEARNGQLELNLAKEKSMQFQLDDKIDIEQVSARLINGVFLISLPLAKAKDNRSIEIS